MVEISGARLGSIILGGFYSATGAIKLFRVDPFTQLHDDQVKTLKTIKQIVKIVENLPFLK